MLKGRRNIHLIQVAPHLIQVDPRHQIETTAASLHQIATPETLRHHVLNVPLDPSVEFFEAAV